MYRIGLAATVLVAFAGFQARAEALSVRDLYGKAEAIVQSLFEPAPVDRELITPPGDVDPRMALAPPAGGTMRLIEPSPPIRQR